jgi:enoyl-[acyl-carrier-protein] reductase (NADH)
MIEIRKKEMKKVDRSFAKIEGFLEAAINEINPSYTPYGPIEAMFVYTPLDKNRTNEVRLIRDELHDILDELKSMLKSLAFMNDDMNNMYLVEVQKENKEKNDELHQKNG